MARDRVGKESDSHDAANNLKHAVVLTAQSAVLNKRYDLSSFPRAQSKLLLHVFHQVCV